jgi:uroporphyrinogen-III synthase
MDRSTIIIAAISQAAAEAAGGGWAAVETAARPTDEALLALAERLCNKSPGG